MTNSQMFKEAHKQAKLDCRAFGGGLVYKEAFGRALKGFYAVKAGFNMQLVEPKRIWA